MYIENHIGGNNWDFSDNIFYKLTGKKVESSYFPKISVYLKEIPKLVPNKKVFGLFWSTPTFKDTDSHYLFHIHDKNEVDYVVSPSSGNTAEGIARAVKKYNKEMNKSIKAILLVPEFSAYKISKSVIENNPYIRYVVIKNFTLDDTRDFARKLIDHLSSKFSVISANSDVKTAAYAQIGLILSKYNLMNDDTCYVQTVSGGVGPAGLIESSYQLKSNPQILVVQPFTRNSTPIVDALNTHSSGGDPLSIFGSVKYRTSQIEPTLGSTRPFYAIEKFVKWRENGGRILPVRVGREELSKYKDKILDSLVKIGIYPNKDIGLNLYDIEKSGFIAFVGAIISAKKVKVGNIIVNFTGRYLGSKLAIPSVALPDILYNPVNNIKELLRKLIIN
ncbi:MAG: hypothetical protein ACXAC5_13790 [Promethearchaeota archaeon]